MKSDLIVIEGFDRIGKDTLLQHLAKKYKSSQDVFVYIQNIPSDMPKYRTDPLGFANWLYQYIDNQLSDLEKLNRDGYKKIIMTRLVLSDFVYSKFFSRKPVVEQFHERIFKTFNLQNVVCLFNNYEEYLKRLEMIHDSKKEYTKEEFERINRLYVDGANELDGEYQIPYQVYYISSKEYLMDVVTTMLG